MSDAKTDADSIVKDVTNLLIEGGCTVNKRAMYELAIYIIEREKKAIERLRPRFFEGANQ